MFLHLKCKGATQPNVNYIWELRDTHFCRTFESTNKETDRVSHIIRIYQLFTRSMPRNLTNYYCKQYKINLSRIQNMLHFCAVDLPYADAKFPDLQLCKYLPCVEFNIKNIPYNIVLL